MLIHRLRKLTSLEAIIALSDCRVCGAPSSLTHAVLGVTTVEGQRVRITRPCCHSCAAIIENDLRTIPATPVTYGQDDSTYDGRADFISPSLTFSEE